MKPAELALIADSLTASTSKTLTGMINVNTAPQQVLMCLPGLTSDDAEAIVAQPRHQRLGNAGIIDGLGGRDLEPRPPTPIIPGY